MEPEPVPLAVGLIGAPGLAGPLRRAGFRVVTGDGFLGAATAIKRVVDGGTALPVLVEETGAAGVGAYLTALAGRGVTAVLLRNGDALIDPADRVPVVDLPARIDDVLAAGGLGPVGGTTGAAVLDVDGTVRDTPTTVPDDPWGEQDPPAGGDPWDEQDPWAGHPAPAQPPPVPLSGGGDGLSGSGPRATPPPTRATRSHRDRAATAPWAPAGQRPPPTCPPDGGMHPRDGDDPWDVFDNAAPLHRPAGPGPRVPDRRGDVLFVFSGKGGVGKTTLALGLAQHAGKQLRVVLVDANRGQGDVRTYLRLGGSALPTIWATAASGDPARAVLTPGEVNAARHRRLQELRFGLVMAPHGDQVDPSTVTPAVYLSVLAAAQDVADLVVVDTQIVEDGRDTTGLIDGLLVPALRDGGWALAVADTSSAGLTNTLQRARTVHAAGIPPDRLMSALSRVPGDFTDRQLVAVADLFGRHTTFLGHVPATPGLRSGLNVGRVAHDDPALRPVLDAALLRVTGDPVFHPPPPLSRRWLPPIRRRR